jgi:hypothetical protein
VGKRAYPLRLDEELRKMLEEVSASEGTPMSQLIREGIEMRCARGSSPSSAAIRAALARLGEAAALLASAAGGEDLGVPFPVSSAAPAAGSWDEAMARGEAS